MESLAQAVADLGIHLLGGGHCMADVVGVMPFENIIAINWRQPVIAWLIAQETSPEKPLDAAFNDLTLP